MCVLPVVGRTHQLWPCCQGRGSPTRRATSPPTPDLWGFVGPCTAPPHALSSLTGVEFDDGWPCSERQPYCSQAEAQHRRLPGTAQPEALVTQVASLRVILGKQSWR